MAGGDSRNRRRAGVGLHAKQGGGTQGGTDNSGAEYPQVLHTVKPTIDIDLKAWQKAARDLFETSSRSAVDFTNGQALRVAVEALKNTEHADAAKIQRELGVVARSISVKKIKRGKNSGKTRIVRGGYVMAGEDTLAHRILYARKKLTGGFGVKGQNIDEAVRNLIRSRIASAHFIRSGWLPGIRKLMAVVRKKPERVSLSRGGARQRGRDKGTARPARFGLTSKIVAEIQNDALNARVKPPSTKGNPEKTGQQGLSKALKESARDMIETLAKRLKQDLAKFGAK